MKYKSVVVTRRGGPEVLQVVENDLRAPNPREIRLKTLASPVSLPDVEARYGRSPFKIRTPFVPGYAVIGVLDALGEAVTQANTGEMVAALTTYGGYSEVCYLDVKQLIPVPASLDPVEVAPLILNYIVAYQTMHRYAKVKQGERLLIIGASGGIGTAVLQLGSLAGLEMYGLASKNKHHVLLDYDATPIDYHEQDFVQVLQKAAPEGIDVVLDGIGGDYIQRSFSLLKDGGRYVGYSNPLSLSGMLRYLARVVAYNLLPNGRSAKFYGTGLSRINREPFLEDWATLFDLLETGRIKPLIAAVYPITEAARANKHLESGNVIGNIVLTGNR